IGDDVRSLMKRFSIAACVSAVVSAVLVAQPQPGSGPPVAPVAPIKEHPEVRHGATIIDNYYWLREKSNPEVTRYLQAENAYTANYTGFRQFSLYVKDLRTGKTLADTTDRVTSVEWAADNKTLFLVTEDAVTKRSDKLWRHVLGSVKFEPLYQEKDDLYEMQ